MSEDPSKIPPGGYCYRAYPLREGEVLSTDRAQFGRSLREYSYHRGRKEVLCPYWQRTDYGTLKCLFTNTEVLDETFETVHSMAMLSQKLGEAEASKFPRNWALVDEIKICGLNEEQEDPWAYDA